MDHTLSVFHVSDCNVNVWPFSSPANVSNRCLSGSTKHRTRYPNIHGLRYKSCDFKELLGDEKHILQNSYSKFQLILAFL